MNVLFLTISSMPHIKNHSISLDLIHEFVRNGHNMYVVCANERKNNQPTALSEEAGCKVLRVRTGNNKKANLIEKGLTTLMLPRLYISAIQKYFTDIQFDLVLYPTPPITHADTVRYIKKRDGARTFLLLKDIFPQNAIDIGMMSKHGLKGLLYRFFRWKEKKLYAISDYIGCMSQANVDYVLTHNPEVDPGKVGICPNSIEIQDMSVSAEDRMALRAKYDIPQDKTIFVYGGNLGKPQGIPFIMDCLRSQKDNSDAFFLIVGDGTEFKKLDAWFSEEQPANAKLFKRLPKEDYDRLAAACDVGLIFLDHRFTIPNFPSRLLSYMQAKLPVLACTDPNTDIGKVITDGNFGWWCESNNPEAFNQLVALAQSADLTSMGENSFTYLSNHYAVEDACQTILAQQMR